MLRVACKHDESGVAMVIILFEGVGPFAGGCNSCQLHRRCTRCNWRWMGSWVN